MQKYIPSYVSTNGRGVVEHWYTFEESHVRRIACSSSALAAT